MHAELITDWTAYDAAVDALLDLAAARLRVVDDDLRRFALERRERAHRLEQWLGAKRQNTLDIALVDAAPLRAASPRLMRLLATYSQQMRVVQLPEGSAPTPASLLLADERHALVRFVTDQPRARLIVDDAPGCALYAEQCAMLLDGGGDPISATTLGL